MNGCMASACATSSALVPVAPAVSRPPACPSKKTTASCRRSRSVSCRATGGGRGEEDLLWLPRRDMLASLSGVAAGLVGYQGFAFASTSTDAFDIVDTCPKGDNVNDKLVDCMDPDRKYPCPPPATNAVVDFKPESTVKRVRRPVHLLDREYQEKYKEAVGKMKALPTSNPLSFAAQAAIHQAYCDGHYHYDPKNKDAAFDVHFSWIFAPWHRMYIHFYERALGQLIGDDTFALPYWNWDTPAGMVIPPLFKDPMANPLYDKNRNQEHYDKVIHLDMKDDRQYVDFDGPHDEIYEETVNGNLCTVYNQQIKNGKDPLHFLGAKLCAEMNRSSLTQGSLERMAHTGVHVWVGRGPPLKECNAETDGAFLGHDGKYTCYTDMGFLGTSGRDPLFYSHHANVDRMWHIWSTKLGGKCFDETEWLDASFVFYDNVENPTPVRVKFRDVLDTKPLGYMYDTESEKDLPWLKCKFTSLVPHGKGSHPRPSPNKKLSFPLSLSKNQVVEFPAVPVPPKQEGKHQVLVIKGVEYDPTTDNKFDVAINVPKNKALQVGPEHHEYAGSFTVVPSSKAGGGTLVGNILLSIGDLLKEIEAHGDSTVDVVIVPRTRGQIKISTPPSIQNH